MQALFRPIPPIPSKIFTRTEFLSVEQENSDEAGGDAAELRGGQGFLVYEHADDQECDCDEYRLHDVADGNLPTSLVHEDCASLQSNDRKAQHERRPVQIA